MTTPDHVKMRRDTREYRDYLAALAELRLGAFPCAHCGRPVINAYCCEHCGSEAPEGHKGMTRAEREADLAGWNRAPSGGDRE